MASGCIKYVTCAIADHTRLTAAQPQNAVTCCPQHTIRLDVAQFTPSRAHKHLRRRLARYLKDGVLPNKEKDGEQSNITMVDATQPNKEKKHFESELSQLTAPVTAALAQALAKLGYTETAPHVTVNDRCHWSTRGHLTSHVSLQLAGRELKEQMIDSPRKSKNSTDPAQKKSKIRSQSPITSRAKEIAAKLIAELSESRDWTMSVAETGHVLIRIINADLEKQLALFVEAHRKPSSCTANNSNTMDVEPKHKLKVIA